MTDTHLQNWKEEFSACEIGGVIIPPPQDFGWIMSERQFKMAFIIFQQLQSFIQPFKLCFQPILFDSVNVNNLSFKFANNMYLFFFNGRLLKLDLLNFYLIKLGIMYA